MEETWKDRQRLLLEIQRLTHRKPMIGNRTLSGCLSFLYPLWPWEFGNVNLQESTDGMENLKPVKATTAASCKVDNVQMLLSALILHDAADGNLSAT